MELQGDSQRSAVDAKTLPLREELELHQAKAHRAVALLNQVIAFIPNKLTTGLPPYGRNPDFPPSEVAEPFWLHLQNVVACSREWPRVSHQAALALEAAAREIGETGVSGLRGSFVVATALACEGLEKFAAGVLLGHGANRDLSGAVASEPLPYLGESIEVIVARHLTDCRNDYPSSQIAGWLGDVDFANVGGVIDREVATAITWAATHFAARNVSAPKLHNAEAKAVAIAKKKGRKEYVIAALLLHHSKPDVSPLENKAIAQAAKVSTATVTRALTEVFGEGGLAAYIAAYETQTLNKKLRKYAADEIARGAMDPTTVEHIRNAKAITHYKDSKTTDSRPDNDQ